MGEVEAAREWLSTSAQVICALLLAVVVDSRLRGTLTRVPPERTPDRWQIIASWRLDGLLRFALILAAGLTVVYDVMGLRTPSHLVPEKLGLPLIIWNALVMLWLIMSLVGSTYLQLRDDEGNQKRGHRNGDSTHHNDDEQSPGIH